MASTKTLFGAGIVLLGVGAIGIGLASPASEEDGVWTGSPAPDFSAVTVDAPVTTRTIADYRGDVLLLNVWATWCPPCVEELPSIQVVYDAYRDRGFRVAAISVDDAGAGELIREFRDSHGLTFEILHDPAFAIFDAYRMNGVPMTFLIDRQGKIRLTRYAADWSTPEHRAEIEKLLAEAAG